MGKRENQVKVWFLTVVLLLLPFSCLIAGSSYNVAVSDVLPISVQAIMHDVETEDFLTGLTVWEKKRELKSEVDISSFIDEIFEASKKNKVQNEPFFGKTKNYLVDGLESLFLIRIEVGGKRFMIAEVAQISSTKFIQASVLHISRDERVLMTIYSQERK